MRETLACDARLEAAAAATAAETKKIWKTMPPTEYAISGSAVPSVKPSVDGKSDCANHAAVKKITPPSTRASTIAFGTVCASFASSVYIVIASKPMNEKHT